MNYKQIAEDIIQSTLVDGTVTIAYYVRPEQDSIYKSEQILRFVDRATLIDNLMTIAHDTDYFWNFCLVIDRQVEDLKKIYDISGLPMYSISKGRKPYRNIMQIDLSNS